MKKTLLIIAVFLIAGSTAFSQLPFTRSISFEDYYRIEQLFGNFNPEVSFVVRPLYGDAFKGFGETFNFGNKLKSFGQSGLRIGNNTLEFKLLPLEIVQQFNSHHPEEFNDGSMIPARGYQSLISTGIFAGYGPLQIHLKPEFVYAENKDFGTFSEINTETFFYRPNDYMDYPERFGETVFNQFSWGQSSIRLTHFGLSLGISNENLWWGPGQRNTLLMTNTAPGFKHISFNTVRPIKSAIGSFEGQIIAGRMESSGYSNLSNNWRYMNAIVLSYQPKWVPGLFLGMIRSFQVYHRNMGNSLGDYLPVISFLTKKSAVGSDMDLKADNQLFSVFMRWLWAESHAEIYFEYGRNDHAWDNRDLMLQFTHSSAYILGFTKLLPINLSSHEAIKINFELTQLEASPTTKNRKGGSWYQYSGHGYTHEGQILGSGIGPGSNLQTVNVSWVNSFKKIGIQLERFLHNNDFWYSVGYRDFRANWVDISAAVQGSWNYRNLIINFNFKFVKSLNYQWLYTPKPDDFWGGKGNDVFNFHAKVGLLYNF